jgi:hypothetical protein
MSGQLSQRQLPDRPSVPARDGQQGTREPLPKTKWKLMTCMRGGGQAREPTAGGFGKSTCACCVPIDLAKCEICRACLPPGQQPEAVAESEPITVAVKLPVYLDESVFRHKQAPDEHFYRLGRETGRHPASLREDPLCRPIFLRSKPYCIVLC